MQLMLAGGGTEKESREIDAVFAKCVLKGNKKILYIPIALKGEIPYDACLDWLISVFSKYNVKITMFTDLRAAKDIFLEDYAGIYIGGGNTFYLLEQFKTFGLDVLLKKYAEQNGCIYGGSAGAIILGKSIQYCPDKNTTRNKDFSGLNLLYDWIIWPHYTKADYDKIVSITKKENCKIIAIAQTSGISVTENGITKFGKGEVILFSQSIVKLNNNQLYLLE